MKKTTHKQPASRKPAISHGEQEAATIAANIPIETKARGKRVRNYKRHAKQVIAGRFVSIMEALADKSAKGSLAHTRYLFELGGVKEDIARQGQDEPEPTLAELLFAEAQKMRAAAKLEGAAAPIAAGTAREEQAIRGGTMERGERWGAKAQ